MTNVTNFFGFFMIVYMLFFVWTQMMRMYIEKKAQWDLETILHPQSGRLVFSFIIALGLTLVLQ